MATAAELITSAAQRLGIIPEEEALTAAAQVRGLKLLNEMLHGFGTQGIYYAHTTLVAADTVNFPDEHLRNVTLLFCYDLADDYEVTIKPKLAIDIAMARSALQAAYSDDNPAVVDRAVISRGSRGFDFTRGE